MGGKLSSNQHHRNYCWLNFSFLAEGRIALLCFRGVEAPHTRLPSRVQTLPYTETSLCLSDRTLYLGSQNRWKHISFNSVFAFIQFPTKVKVTLYPAPFLISSLFSHLYSVLSWLWSAVLLGVDEFQLLQTCLVSVSQSWISGGALSHSSWLTVIIRLSWKWETVLKACSFSRSN